MESQLKSQIGGEEKNNQDAKIFGEENKLEATILKELSTYNYNDYEILRKRDISSEEYKNVSKAYKDLWQNYFDQYINVYI